MDERGDGRRDTGEGTALEVLAAFLRLGLTSFGGPVAHIGYFREEFVNRRGWFADRAYADLVALCQFLPGPASSQVGFAIGLSRAGWPGALCAWCGFTLPSAILLVGFAYGVSAFAGDAGGGWLTGLKAAAVAVVAQAVWGMARTLCPDRARATLAVAAAAVVLFVTGTAGQLAAIGLGAAAGAFLPREERAGAAAEFAVPVSRRTALVALALFVAVLAGLPLAVAFTGSGGLALVDAFYRSGALVFGGGHVLLPLLQAEVVEPGWVDRDTFVAGYGAAQAIPGPLFAFSAYLGASASTGPGGVAGAALCLLAVFAPSVLLVAGFLPFWDAVRRAPAARSVLAGVNAAVVGLLLAALYDPVWKSGVAGPRDLALALAAFALLAFWKAPPWLVVVLAALGGAALEAVTG